MYGRWISATPMVGVRLAKRPGQTALVIVSGFSCASVKDQIVRDFAGLDQSIVLASGPVTPESLRKRGRNNDLNADLIKQIRIGIQIATAGRGVQPVHVIAHSVGCAAAAALCDDPHQNMIHGMRVSGLTFISPFMGLNAKLNAKWAIRLQRVVESFPSIAQRMPSLGAMDLDDLVCHTRGTNSEKRALTRNIGHPYEGVPLAGALELEQFGKQFKQRLSEISVPTWVLQGDDDTFGEPYDTQWLRSQRNIMDVRKIEGCHFALFDPVARAEVVSHIRRLTLPVG